MKRVIHVQAKLSEARHQRLREKAKKAGMTIGEFIAALVESREVVTAKTDLRPALQELAAWCGRLNSNLNMISKHANTYREAADAALILLALADIRGDVLNVAQLANELRSRRRRAEQ